MDKLLDERAAMSPLTDSSIHFAQAIEVMGIMDLKAFVVGRQYPSLQVWRRYRSGQLIRSEEETDAIQSMSGLPHTMVDLLALDDNEVTEEQFWLWPGCRGTLIQCQMWDAYRFAMMIDMRRRRTGYLTINRSSVVRLPNDDILVTKALSSIDAVYNGFEKPAAATSLVMNAMLLPLFHVALEVLTADNFEGRHELITTWFEFLLSKLPYANTKQAWELVQDYASERKNGLYRNADDIARSKGIEVGLF